MSLFFTERFYLQPEKQVRGIEEGRLEKAGANSLI
jgi:hypothetical protein